MEYPTSNMNSGQSAYTTHPQDNTRISPGCNPQPNPSPFPTGDTGPHGRAYSSYPPAYQTPAEFGGPGGHSAPTPPTYPHVYPPESHGQSLTLNQLLQQGNTSNNYPPRPHGGPPLQAYRAYEHYPYGYKPGVPGGVGERPQGNTYPYVGTQGQRYTDPYGRPTYPPGSTYSYYQSASPQPIAQPTLQRQQPASSVAASSSSCALSASSAQAHSTEFNSSNPGPPTRPAQPQTLSVGVHPNEHPPPGAMNTNNAQHTHAHPSPVHGSQLSSPLHGSASNINLVNNTSQAPTWSGHALQPPFGSPHQLTHGQMPSTVQQNSNIINHGNSNRPRSASRESMKTNAADGCSDPAARATPQPSETDRMENQMPTADESGSRPHSRMSDSGRPSTANSISSAGVRDQPSDEQNATTGATTTSSSSTMTASSTIDSGPVGSAGSAQVDASPSTAGSTFVSNPTLSPIPTTPRGTPPSNPYTMFSHPGGGGGTPSPLQAGVVHTVSASNRPPSQTCQSPRPYGLPQQSAMGSRQPYSPYQHPLTSPQPQPHYMVGGRPPGFYSNMGGPGTVLGVGGHPSMRSSMHPMGSIPGPGLGGRSGPPFGSQGMIMPPPAAPPPPSNPSQGNIPGPGTQPMATGFISGGSYPAPGSGPSGPPSNTAMWDSHQHPGSTPMSSPISSMPQPHFGGSNGGRPSPLYSGIPDRGMGYPGSPQPGVASLGPSVPPHSSPHPHSSMAPGGYPHPHPQAQPPISYPSHASHTSYLSSQLPYGSAPHPSVQHGYLPGISGSAGTGTAASSYPTGSMAPPGPGASGQLSREPPQPQQPMHAQYTNDAGGPTDRTAPPSFCAISPSAGPSGCDPTAFSTSLTGTPSPASVVRGVPVSSLGTPKMPPGNVMGKVAKMESGIRPNTPNNCGPTMPNASPLANVGSVAGVTDESGTTPNSLSSHQALQQQHQTPPHSGANTNSVTAQQPLGQSQQQQSLPPCAMPPSGQSGMQPFSVGPSAYWSDGGGPNQFPGSLPPAGMGPQGPHPFQSFHSHYRLPGSGAPQPSPSQPVPQGLQQQHAHGMPNSITCPTSVSGGMYGLGISPYGNAQGHPHPSVGHCGISSQSSSVFHRLLEMGSEPERRGWLEHYVRFMEEIGKPLVGLPQVVKQPLDLYRFYLAVRERGGVIEVIKTRRWKEISQLVNINASASAAYTLRKNYCKFLLDYECRFDRGGADPNPLLAHIEAMSGKKKKPTCVDDGSTTLSASGHGLSTQAPPSPAGSHSSASSSLLPPGSGSASLSGVPSGTAGSAASDSQLGPSGAQSRFGDPCTQSSNSAVGESPNGMLSSPGSGVLSAHGTTVNIGPTSFSQSAAPSPQRPPSSAMLNGYPSSSHASTESVSRSNANWSWISESAGLNCHPSPVVSVNGFPSSMSPIRGPLSVHGVQHGFDSNSRPAGTTPIASPKTTQPRAVTPNSVATPLSQSARSPTPSNFSANTPSSIVGLPCSNPNMVVAGMKSSELTMHHQEQQQSHHPLTNHYPPPVGPPAPPPPNHSQIPQPPHASFMGSQSHPTSPMHPSMPPHAFSGQTPPPGSALHPRLAGAPSSGIRSSPFSTGPGGINAPHSLGAPPPSDSIALLRMHNIRPPSSGSSSTNSSYPPNAIPPFHQGQLSSTAPAVPAHLIHHHGQRPGYVTTILKRLEHPFPPGSIEATPVEATRRRRYRTKDIGTVSPFKLLMALRSGLTAEVAWALNCLNILLRDENGLENFTGGSLNALITNLTELWRHSLGELFDHNLFVCSLELPTNMTVFARSLDGSRKSGSGTKESRSRHVSPIAFTLYRNYSPGVCVPNGLASLERDLVTLAMKRGVPITSLRDGIRRLLRKCGDPIGEFIPMRARNGPLLNQSSNMTGSNAPLVPHSISSLVDPSPTATRTRKRGSKQLTSGYGYLQSNLGAPTAVSGVSHSTSYSITVLPHTNSPIKSESIPQNFATRVTTATNSFRSPEAYTNLRELALFVIDELLETNPILYSRSDGENKDAVDHEMAIPPHETDRLGMPNPRACWSASAYLRSLIQHGGGDTTCHIMPPFGAAPYSSQHWSSNQDPEVSSARTFGRPGKNLSPPPPEVIEEKCSSRNDLVECGTPEVDDEDETHTQIKRVRHASNSSLPCPVLSPQPIEGSDESEVKSFPPLTVQSKTNPEKSNSSSECSMDKADLTVEPQGGTELSQLVIDANGRCPLRAREELVHHGPSCLWPNHSESDSNEARAVRCLCVSTVLRNLSFWHLAEIPLSSHRPTLALIGRIMLLGHEHVGVDDTWQSVENACKRMEPNQCAWRTPSWLEDMRENSMVLLVNLAGYLDLIRFEESIVRPILEGLLHWIVCPTAVAIDPFPGHRTLSPRRLALEALNRLCVHDSNVDLLLSTPGSREADLHLLFGRLAHWLALPEDQVTRELALSTMHYLTGGGVSFSTLNDQASGKSRNTSVTSVQSGSTSFIGTTLLASAKPCPVAGLLSFIEAAEATTRRVIDQYGVQALQERPELMGTSLEMVRRAGALLDRLASDPTGRTRFTPTLELRLLDLVTSRVLDATVAHLLCGALHRLSQHRSHVENTAEIRVTIPLVPPIPALSVVTQLLQTTATNKSESSNNSENASNDSTECKMDAPKAMNIVNQTSPNKIGDTNLAPKPVPLCSEPVPSLPEVSKEEKTKSSYPNGSPEDISTKSKARILAESMNHIDDLPHDVTIKRERIINVTEDSLPKTDNRESPVDSLVSAMECSSCNSNCVDS